MGAGVVTANWRHPRAVLRHDAPTILPARRWLAARMEVLVSRLVEHVGEIAANQTSTQRIGLYEQVMLVIGVLGLVPVAWANSPPITHQPSSSENLTMELEDTNATLRRIEVGIEHLQSLASAPTIPSSAQTHNVHPSRAVYGIAHHRDRNYMVSGRCNTTR